MRTPSPLGEDAERLSEDAKRLGMDAERLDVELQKRNELAEPRAW